MNNGSKGRCVTETNWLAANLLPKICHDEIVAPIEGSDESWIKRVGC
jgi:hypothetical protein